MRLCTNSMPVWRRAVLALTAALVWSCTPPDELDGDELEPSMEWDDLVSQDGSGAVKDASKDENSTLRRPPSGRTVLKVGRLGRAAALSAIENPAPYAGGILGTKGDSKYFIASTDVVPGYNRLYWVMVKLLSERYSCFMRSKVDVGNITRVSCKDGRQVMFWKKQNPDFIEFVSRQFDREGYEIKVIRRKIVRISSVRVI